MKKLYQIKPILEERIWGGRGLIDKFHLETDLNNVAEIYFVIAIPGHLDCMVEGEQVPLSQFYWRHPELFGCHAKDLPVRMVAGHSIKPLSVQLHPEDAYALAHEGMRGKPESELILGENGKGELILGHYANTREEFAQLVESKQWDKLFRKIEIKSGDFIDIPACTLHGSLGEGMVVAFSTNGDVTYRLYDYDRLDDQGNPRELHVEHVIKNVTVPDQNIGTVTYKTIERNGCQVSYLYDKPGSYSCGRIKTITKGSFALKEFYFMTCIEGKGTLEGIDIQAGDTYLIPCDYGSIELAGTMDMVYISYKD